MKHPNCEINGGKIEIVKKTTMTFTPVEQEEYASFQRGRRNLCVKIERTPKTAIERQEARRLEESKVRNKSCTISKKVIHSPKKSTEVPTRKSNNGSPKLNSSISTSKVQADQSSSVKPATVKSIIVSSASAPCRKRTTPSKPYNRKSGQRNWLPEKRPRVTQPLQSSSSSSSSSSSEETKSSIQPRPASIVNDLALSKSSEEPVLSIPPILIQEPKESWRIIHSMDP